MIDFDGFNKEIYNFFGELSKNNSKEWFDNNRKFYEKEIKNASKNFIESMKVIFQSSNLDYVADPKVNLFRINRDIRFSQNKDPYKTNMGIFFPHRIDVPNSKKMASGIYLHFGLDECFIATGMHSPEPALLKLLRKKISDNWYDFESIINDEVFKNDFPKIYDEQNVLKKVTGYTDDNPAYQYLKRKSFTYFKDLKNDTFYSHELMDVALKSAKSSQEFSIFLNDVLLEL